MVVPRTVEAVVVPIAVPSIEPPLIETLLAFCVDIVPRPETCVLLMAIEVLVTEFGPQLQGEHKARDAITKARGFLKGKSWNPTRLREWLEGDVESLTMKQRNGNGTHTNQSGHQELTVEEYKRAWGIRT